MSVIESPPRTGVVVRAHSGLLRALRARTATHPDNPGLVASWPAVPETRMDNACGELVARGHALFRIAIPGRIRNGWAIRSGTEAPPLARAFQLKERVTSSDARDPHVAAQLIERIGWALADAEDVEMRQSVRPKPPGGTA